MNSTFDRYSQFRQNNIVETVPFIKIPSRQTDIKIIYNKGQIRLDQISYQYYNSADYAWLILQANPQYGALEFNIPDGVELRIPLPLDIVLSDYQKSIEEYYIYNN
jgi:hypothetical protein